MPGAVGTLNIKDAGGTSRTMRVWDESGAGSGPYSFMHVLADGNASTGAPLAQPEDDGHSSGDFGFPVWAVRRDTAAVGSGSDGDYSSLNVDSSGRLRGLASIDQTTPGTTNKVWLTDISDAQYETVAAGQTDQVLGTSSATTGDYLAGVLIVPGTTSPGNVLIQDGAGSAVTIFTGGADSVSNLVPFFVPLGIRSTAGAWSLTTGSNVTAIAVGNFT